MTEQPVEPTPENDPLNPAFWEKRIRDQQQKNHPQKPTGLWSFTTGQPTSSEVPVASGATPQDLSSLEGLTGRPVAELSSERRVQLAQYGAELKEWMAQGFTRSEAVQFVYAKEVVDLQVQANKKLRDK